MVSKLRPLFKINEETLNKLKQLIPEAFKDGLVDIGALSDALSEYSGEDLDIDDKLFGLYWPGKREAKRAAANPPIGTLVPVPGDGVNEETTKNIYIEGDNLEVLKIIRKAYLGKIKMIYIDPPYNTGNDFIYPDDFSESEESYLRRTGQIDENSIPLTANKCSEGRFHSKWCSMMYPRLRLARDLLTDDGVIFISIGEEEIHCMKNICNEIFGDNNFRNSIFTRRYDKNINRQFMEDGLSSMNTGLEYILIYSKDQSTKYNPVYRESNEKRATFGYWKGFWNDANRPTMRYSILGVIPDNGQWKWKKEVADEAIQNYINYCDNFQNNMSIEEYWESTGKSKKFIRRNLYGKGKNQGVEHWIPPATGILRNTNWSDLLASKPTGTDVPFDSPKNIEVIIELLKLSNISENGITLDFFPGSSTTAHAVMQLNAEDGGNRQFIMVQIQEKCDEKSEAYKAGFKNICEIGKERIRRAGRKIVDSDQWLVAREKEMKEYGCIELSGFDRVAKVNVVDNNNLQNDKKAPSGGNLFTVGSNKEIGGVNTVKHSGRSGAEFDKGIHTISFDSKRVQSGTGDTTPDMPEGRIPCRYGYYGSDVITQGNRKNAQCPHKKTSHCPLTTNHSLDTGFKVYRLAPSNFKQVKPYTGTNVKELPDWFSGDPLVEGWKPENLTTEVMLKEGFPIDSTITKLDVYKKNKVYQVSSDSCDHSLVLCLDAHIESDTIEKLDLGELDIFICLDSAISDQTKARLDDKGRISVI